MDLSFLPAVNATLNGVALLLLAYGRILIRRKRVDAHRRTMLSAFAVSSLFLALYIAHKVWRGFEHTVFHGEGFAEIFYFSVLFSHLILAMIVPILAVTLIVLGLRGRIAAHRRLARPAWAIWMYVSLTGVLIYLMLYPLNPLPPSSLG